MVTPELPLGLLSEASAHDVAGYYVRKEREYSDCTRLGKEKHRKWANPRRIRLESSAIRL